MFKNVREKISEKRKLRQYRNEMIEDGRFTKDEMKSLDISETSHRPRVPGIADKTIDVVDKETGAVVKKFKRSDSYAPTAKDLEELYGLDNEAEKAKLVESFDHPVYTDVTDWPAYRQERPTLSKIPSDGEKIESPQTEPNVDQPDLDTRLGI